MAGIVELAVAVETAALHDNQWRMNIGMNIGRGRKEAWIRPDGMSRLRWSVAGELSEFASWREAVLKYEDEKEEKKKKEKRKKKKQSDQRHRHLYTCCISLFRTSNKH